MNPSRSAALREAGRKIPRDVAVTGFDDIPEGLAEVPPMTSVHYPLFETGYRALLLLHKRIEQGPGSLPDLTRVGTWLAPRQSCGCLPEMIANSVFGGDPNPPSTDPFSQEFRKGLSHSMLDALLTENTQYHSGDFLPFCESLSNGFLDSLKENSIVPFQDALTDVLQHVEMDTYDNAHVWQSAVSVLRRAAYAVKNGGDNEAPAR